MVCPRGAPDTDMFPTDPALSTYIMKRVIEQGGLQPGGLNFDAKVSPSLQTFPLHTCLPTPLPPTLKPTPSAEARTGAPHIPYLSASARMRGVAAKSYIWVRARA